MRTTLFALLLVLVLPLAFAGPPKDDISGGFFVPDAPDLPSPPEIDPGILGQALVLVTDGLNIGDTVASSIGGLTTTIDVNSLGGLDVVQGAGGQVQELHLPPLPSGSDMDLQVIHTPFSTVFDRVGDNAGLFGPEIPVSGAEDLSKLSDFTLLHHGMLSSFDVAQIITPAGVTATTQVIDYQAPLESIVSYFLIDPESQLRVIRDTNQLTPQELTSLGAAQTLTSATSIEAALAAISVDSLTLDGVLSGLKDASQKVGFVDLDLFSQALATDGIGVKTITDAAQPGKMLLDLRNPSAPNFAFINGGTGKIAGLAGQDYVFDSDLVTRLKDPTSTSPTSFVAVVTKDGVAKAATAKFDPSLGNYRGVLDKTSTLMGNGFDVKHVKSLADCKGPELDQAQEAPLSRPSFCMDATKGLTVSKQTSDTVRNLLDRDPKLKRPCPFPRASGAAAAT